MTPVVKTMSILTWALAVGKDLSTVKSERTDKPETSVQVVREKGKAVHDAAREAIMAWPKNTFKKNNLKKIADNIQYLDGIGHVTGTHKRLEIMIAVLLAGVEDLLEVVSHQKRRSAVTTLVDKLMDLSAVVDPDGTQTAHYIRGDYAYRRWIES